MAVGFILVRIHRYWLIKRSGQVAVLGGFQLEIFWHNFDSEIPAFWINNGHHTKNNWLNTKPMVEVSKARNVKVWRSFRIPRSSEGLHERLSREKVGLATSLALVLPHPYTAGSDFANPREKPGLFKASGQGREKLGSRPSLPGTSRKISPGFT